MRFERVYLVGFMGSGKTTVGPLVAERLKWSFIDLDREIEIEEKRAVAAIFRDSGEPYFRSVERRCLERTALKRQAVVALGGGAYQSTMNRELVDRSGVSVYLETPLETILARVPADGSRPLFSTPQEIRRLFLERVASYKMARLRVNTEKADPTEVAGRIVRLIETL